MRGGAKFAMFAGYEIQGQIHEGPRCVVLRATQRGTGKPVVLKVRTREPSLSSALVRAQHECLLGSSIHSAHVVRYLEVLRDRDRVAVVEESFGDRSLSDVLAREGLGIASALSVGLQIAQALVDVHAQGVIHRAVHPGNVVVQTTTLAAKLVDLAEASVLTHTPSPLQRPDDRALPVLYMSPEQTGRMNRTVDVRTDLYSLGTTLYHALAGHPPFESEDLLSIVHAHIAVAPRPLSDLDPGIPRVVSDLVLRLLAKNPEDRYQSARGVLADLKRCSERYGLTGDVEPFPLGTHDASSTFRIPEKLYGRTAERERLLEAFRFVGDGGKGLLLVCGTSGIGKSSLVSEIHTPVAVRGARFLAGKFEPLQRHVPYSALGRALSQLSRTLLGAPEDDLARLRTRIIERVGANVSIICDLVPELAAIVGPHPQAQPVGPVEAQHRFDLALARFLSVFATKEHPLVLFLDDLQWADPATLHALVGLLRTEEPSHLLVIGAYRDNEVDEGHPLLTTIQELRRSEVPLWSLHLRELPTEAVELLLADTLHAPASEVRPLAERVVEKTSGNPFFVDEFLRSLHADGHLRFDANRACFTYDLSEIDALDSTPNVVAWLIRKLDRLPALTQEILRLGACIGGRFDLDLLSAVAGLSLREARMRLALAIRERLIVPLDRAYPMGPVDGPIPPGVWGAEDQENYEYRFLHDRVQQAVLTGIADETRQGVHVRIGRMLLARTKPGACSEDIFRIVDQLNAGSASLADPTERVELAFLNLEAGTRARARAAYAEGLAYFRLGLALLPDNAWDLHYRQTFALHLGYAECAYVVGHFEEAEAFARAFFPMVRTARERAELYAVQVALETNRGRYERATAVAREALAVLGHPVPSFEATEDFLEFRRVTAEAMRGLRAEDLRKRPTLTDPTFVAITNLIEKILASAYLADRKFFVWAVYENLKIANVHGVTAASATGFICYGMLLIAEAQDYERASAFGELAISLVEQDDVPASRSQVYTTFAMGIGAYTRPMRTLLPLFRAAIDLGLESGNVHFARYGAAMLPQVVFVVGDSVDDFQRQVDACEHSIRYFNNADTGLTLRIMTQSVRCLRGETEAPASLTTADIAESELVSGIRGTAALPVRGVYYAFKLIALTLFGVYPEATRFALDMDAVAQESLGALFLGTEYGFFACIALINGLRDDAFDKAKLHGLIARRRAMLDRWAASAPMNFHHQKALVAAELADLEDRPSEAMALYDEAIRGAADHGVHHHAAFASELAARALVRRGRGEQARSYFESARAGYMAWGAPGKVRALDKDFPGLAARAVDKPLDVIGVVRASQALSSEISLPALLEKVMRAIVQTSGAQRGSLLVERDGALKVEAHLDVDKGSVDIFPAASSPVGLARVSEAIVRYTLRTREDVVLDDASRVGAFTFDPFVTSHGSKSILCMALRHQDRISGVLFLENALTVGAFATDRLEVLRLLVAQATISLENARLYQSTQALNRELVAKEALLRDVLDGLPIGVSVFDIKGRPAFVNRLNAAILNREIKAEGTIEDLLSTQDVYVAGTDEPYPTDRGVLLRALRGEHAMADDIEVRLPDRTVQLAVWGTPIRGDDGEVQYAMLAAQDITAQRAAEASHARLEEQLRLAERLESIGKLAGGVAHDFNNLLTPMLVYADVVLRTLPPESPQYMQVEQIREAAERAAELTRQLLAFGRRQVLDARALDLNHEVRTFVTMLRRLVREDVVIELRLASELAKIRADASQIHRIIMNLAMNAADAMPAGGQLTLETGAAHSPDASGDELPCAVLRVIDTGQGMDQATLARIFEPFFTTKPPGQGTGLGLPTVYGLVSQHGGHVAVKSEPGQGTTFEVFLPFAEQAAPPPRAATPTRDEDRERSGQGESILVVEDDAAVRAVVVTVLTREGYDVVAAADPTEALRLAAKMGRGVRLVVTDVVMPRMNGRQLVTELTRELPTLKALYISGYSADAISERGLLDEGIELLQKPFSTEDLCTRVRTLLDAP